MRQYLRDLGLAVRHWPGYTGLAVLGLLVLVSAGRHGYRLLGDDDRTSSSVPKQPAAATQLAGSLAAAPGQPASKNLSLHKATGLARERHGGRLRATTVAAPAPASAALTGSQLR